MGERTCAVEGCDRPFLARGWCGMHWQRWRKHGEPGPAAARTRPSHVPPLNDAVWLREQYETQRRTLHDIALELGRSDSTVMEAMHRHGIAPRARGTRGAAYGCWKDSEEKRAAARAYYARHAEERRQAMRQRRLADPAKVREIARRSYVNNRDKALEYAAQYRAENREQVLERLRRWRAANPGVYRRWREENRDRLREYWSRRRALKHGAHGSHTTEEFVAACEAHDGRCAYCGDEPGRLTADHVVPLSRGGSDDIENIVPACARCNSRKGTRSAEEFMADQGMV